MKVKLTTNKGEIVLALDAVNAPETTKNFLSYVQEGFYDGTIFHRVIEGFMIQGGGHLPDLKPKAKIRAPIKNEADNGLSNTKGTIAMARTGDPTRRVPSFSSTPAITSFLTTRHRRRKAGVTASSGKSTTAWMWSRASTRRAPTPGAACRTCRWKTSCWSGPKSLKTTLPDPSALRSRNGNEPPVGSCRLQRRIAVRDTR